MKVAILWYGRQWKKHEQAWKELGVNPDIFTRSGKDDSRTIDHFRPNQYQIIIVAIDPLYEQTKMIEMILQSAYKNYLIIEKPITDSRKLLEILASREKTIYFLDELFYPMRVPEYLPKKIMTTSSETYSDFAISEHAIAHFLVLPSSTLDFSTIEYSHSVEANLTYTLTFEDWIEDVFMDMKKLHFSSVYKGLLLRMKDEPFMQNIRNNYLLFRSKTPHFAQYLKP
jgi:hypothetical protein